MNAIAQIVSQLQRYPMHMQPIRDSQPSVSFQRERDAAILKLTDGVQLTTAEIAHVFDANNETFRAVLRRLERAGKLVQIAGPVRKWIKA